LLVDFVVAAGGGGRRQRAVQLGYVRNIYSVPLNIRSSYPYPKAPAP